MPFVNATLDHVKSSKAPSEFSKPHLKYLTVSCQDCFVSDSNSVLNIFVP